MGIITCALFLVFSINHSVHASDDVQRVLELDSQVSETQSEFQYDGERQLTSLQSQRLLSEMQRREVRQALERAQDCQTCSHAENISRDDSSSDSRSDGEVDGRWEVVVVGRLGIRRNMNEGSTLLSEYGEAGAERFSSDFAQISNLVNAGTFSQADIDSILDRSSSAIDGNHNDAMAYVAALGAALRVNYGRSAPGKFVSQFEQYGNIVRGRDDDGNELSVGQCSDIHYAMLRSYNRLMGGRQNTKAYLVNFQTGGDLHHTNLVIEKDGEVFIVDYGNVTKVPTGTIDPLRQDRRAGQSLAYRIFDEGTEVNDQMVAHVDTPLGMMLREVSTGTSSHNPFQSTDYSLFSVEVESPNDTFQVRTFFGELGGGDKIIGIAVQVRGETELPAGFNLQSHFSSAFAYAAREYRTDSNIASLDSKIIYLNTGLGLHMPELHLGDFSFNASTSLALEGGVWFKTIDDPSRSPEKQTTRSKLTETLSIELE